MTAPNAQAMEVPLVELLRGIPNHYRVTIPFQWAEDGTETGHHMIPAGTLMHKAADRIEQLRSDKTRYLQVMTEQAAEIERLRRDAERLDWLADKNNYYGEVKLPTLFVVKHVDSLRDAIDATMKFAAIDAASAGER